MSSVSSARELSKIKVSWKLLELAVGTRIEIGFVWTVFLQTVELVKTLAASLGSGE